MVLKIGIAESNDEITACYGVMSQLRPHVAEADFLPRVREQARAGYRLAYVENAGRPVAVAGFRVSENLAWGRFLYVDDLVTGADHRSQGYGAALLSWLKEHAVGQGCAQLHLDSGLQRKDAHRFYEREGVCSTGYHFAQVLMADDPRFRS